MKAPPADLDSAAVLHCLDRYWEIRPSRLEYLPVGFGDHHWDATADAGRFFLTVRDLQLDTHADDPHLGLEMLDRTFRAVRDLKEAAGLSFIVPALPSKAGATVVGVDRRFALSVFEWIEVGPLQDPGNAIAARLVGQLHRASRVHRVQAVRENFSIPHRPHLEDALEHLRQPWLTGPFAEPSRELLATHETDVRSALRRYDQLVAIARTATSGWCLTHGEPSGGNLIEDHAGAPCLVDWESARLAPPERDLAQLSLNEEALALYLHVAGGPLPQPDILRMYKLFYDLAESAVYLLQFRAPHTADDNMIESWQNFQTFLPTSARWPPAKGLGGAG